MNALHASIAEDFNIHVFLFNLLLTIVFSSALGFLFQRFSLSFADRRRLASTFVLLSVAIMCVISVVKFSLALSLGLVGALSIVRFRTAIKDPEELVFLFLTIVIGIAHGANQSVIGAAVFVVSAALLLLRYFVFTRLKVNSQYSHVVLTGTDPVDQVLASVNAALKDKNVKSELRRIDSTDGHTECVLDMLFPNIDAVTDTIEALKAKRLSVTYIAGSGE